MPDRFRERMENLRRRSLVLCGEVEQAEAYAADVEDLLRIPGVEGFIAQTLVLGSVIHRQSYDPGFGPPDSEQIYQAAIVAPPGLGAVLWDLDHFQTQQHSPEGLEPDAWVRFIPFRDCPRIVKSRLLPEVDSLLDRLLPPARVDMRPEN